MNPDAPDWRYAAACRQQPDLWHHPDARMRRDAVQLCHACPVRDRCAVEREAALDAGAHLYGVWAAVDFGMARGYQRYPQPPHARANAAHCGTPSGYARHVRLGEPTCDECREAVRRDREARRSA